MVGERPGSPRIVVLGRHGHVRVAALFVARMTIGDVRVDANVTECAEFDANFCVRSPCPWTGEYTICKRRKTNTDLLRPSPPSSLIHHARNASSSLARRTHRRRKRCNSNPAG